MQLNQVDFAFNPREVTITSGDSIEVRNTSARTPHTFTIEGKGIDVTNNAGESETVTIDLKPGTYSFVCRFHATGGMTGTLIVK